MIGWRPLGQDPALCLKVTAINGAPIEGTKFQAKVQQGKTQAEYMCKLIGTSTDAAEKGRVSIDAKDGMMYYIRPLRRVNTKSWVSRETLFMTTTVTRSAGGVLLGDIEPVYVDIPRTQSNITGCDAEVIACRGYLYSEREGWKYLCLQEEMSTFAGILFKGQDQWVKMY